MKITVLGSGDAFGSGGRFNTCLHVEARDRALMPDCGSSSTKKKLARAHDGLVIVP